MSKENNEEEILKDLKEALETSEELEQSQEQKNILHKLSYEIKKEFEESKEDGK